EHVGPYSERVVTKAFGHVELAFDDLLDQLHAGGDPPGVEETLEPKHRSHPRLDAPVVLLHDVVQVGACADVDRAFPTVIKFVIHGHPAQGGMRGLETVQGNYSWVAVTAKRPPEKRLGGGDVAGTAEVGSTVLPCLSTARYR